MKRISILVACIASLLMLSCATQPSAQLGADRPFGITVRLASRAETDYAGSLTPPYKVPDAIIFKIDREFVVLAIEVDSPKGGEEIKLLSLNADSGQARYYEKSDFVGWWMAAGDISGDQAWKRYVDRTYLPASSFRAHLGKQVYYAVLMGKKPLARPLAINASFLVNGELHNCEVECD
jgi:hypothetical protein